MLSLKAAQMSNNSRINCIPQDMSAPQSLVHFHGTNNVLGGKRSLRYMYSIPEGDMNISNFTIDNSDAFVDMTSNNDYSIRGQNHKAGGLGLARAMSSLSLPITDNKHLCNGHPLKIQDDYEAESRSLIIGTGNNVLTSSTAPEFGGFFRDLASRNKVQVRSICITQMRSCVALCIGQDHQIPRWRNGSELLYKVCADSFETPSAATLVTAAMKMAISMWGKMEVDFKLVSHDNPATFRIKYKKSHNSHPNVYAKSFLPRECASSLVVYQRALEHPSYYLANILAHELGHILGLRHEFALKTEEFLPSVRFGSENHQSIMNYFDHPSKLQVSEQDREELAAFYAYGQADYQGLPIVDVTPLLTHDW